MSVDGKACMVRLRPYAAADEVVAAGWYREEAVRETALGTGLFPEALPRLMDGVPGLCMLEYAQAPVKEFRCMTTGAPAGLLSAQLRQTSRGRVLWIRLLLVAPELRRNGLGRAAVAQLTALPQVRGQCDRILLAVDSRNAGALAFWTSLGFQHIRNVGNGIFLLGREAA